MKSYKIITLSFIALLLMISCAHLTPEQRKEELKRIENCARILPFIHDQDIPYYKTIDTISNTKIIGSENYSIQYLKYMACKEGADAVSVPITSTTYKENMLYATVTMKVLVHLPEKQLKLIKCAQTIPSIQDEEIQTYNIIDFLSDTRRNGNIFHSIQYLKEQACEEGADAVSEPIIYRGPARTTVEMKALVRKH